MLLMLKHKAKKEDGVTKILGNIEFFYEYCSIFKSTDTFFFENYFETTLKVPMFSTEVVPRIFGFCVFDISENVKFQMSSKYQDAYVCTFG